ncbi:MAG: HEPN domain-containing protein [bacterium]|nr:HEPN domain-containing protein [bacterium]
MNLHNSHRLPDSPDEWLAHARSDLHLAKLGRQNKEILYPQICFHTQQAAEKAFKAVLLHGKIDFPLTHDLQILIDILSEADIPLPPDIDEASSLTPYAVETRYPGFYESITESEVDKSIYLAEKMVIWAEDYILQKK